MEKECMEEGLASTKRPLLLGERNFINSDKPKGDSSFTPVLFLGAIVALCGNFCFGFAAGYTSTAEFEMMEDLGMSIAAYSFFGSIMTVGAAIGAILSGKMADFVGRKRTMWLSQIFCIMGWLGIAFAKNVWGVNIGRVSIGFAVGLIAYVVPVYIAEITPKNIRGRFVVTLQLMNCSGLLAVFFLGNFFSWRTVSLLAIIPCLMQVVGLVFVPESPRWLASIGKEIEFEDALRRLRGVDAGFSQEAIEIKDATENFQRGEAGFQGLFQKKYAYPVMIGVGLMLLQQLGGNSVFAAYLSTVFAKANVSTTIGPTAIAFLQMPAAVLGVLLMDAFGRRALLMVSSIASCLCLSIMGLSFYLQEHQYAKEFTPLMVFLGVLGFSYAFAIGMSGIPWVIMSEIFPINIKASAGSLVTLVNWSCSWLVTFAFNFMLEWNSAGTFFFFASMSAMAFLFTWIMVPETKGRSLEEIQATLITYVY
ncbi:PREDICTED: sugar transporter ERD6-like 18 [Populus euphratica]|uniref:Sugar transporter ERD6-like 18 n=1 Tax=Populus euphratica TaxID=75702 RepID=A0AAJ6XLN0_POPEU|nr:PREDICTED: sugar transporter ERD6-like 18 [Populus euphratica]